MFRIIFSRGGTGLAGAQAGREQRIVDRKVIVVLSDENAGEMLRATAEARDPEEPLQRNIAAFRTCL